MTWIYQQRTGIFEHDGVYVATGYSGQGAGKNNPELQGEVNLGPIPQGFYLIGRPFDSQRTGPHVMQLVPQGHDALGRTDLQVHGDSRESPGAASTGCIVLARHIREQIAEARDNLLEVVSGDKNDDEGVEKGISFIRFLIKCYRRLRDNLWDGV